MPAVVQDKHTQSVSERLEQRESLRQRLATVLGEEGSYKQVRNLFEMLGQSEVSCKGGELYMVHLLEASRDNPDLSRIISLLSGELKSFPTQSLSWAKGELVSDANHLCKSLEREVFSIFSEIATSVPFGRRNFEEMFSGFRITAAFLAGLLKDQATTSLNARLIESNDEIKIAREYSNSRANYVLETLKNAAHVFSVIDSDTLDSVKEGYRWTRDGKIFEISRQTAFSTLDRGRPQNYQFTVDGNPQLVLLSQAQLTELFATAREINEAQIQDESKKETKDFRSLVRYAFEQIQRIARSGGDLMTVSLGQGEYPKILLPLITMGNFKFVLRNEELESVMVLGVPGSSGTGKQGEGYSNLITYFTPREIDSIRKDWPQIIEKIKFNAEVDGSTQDSSTIVKAIVENGEVTTMSRELLRFADGEIAFIAKYKISLGEISKGKPQFILTHFKILQDNVGYGDLNQYNIPYVVEAPEGQMGVMTSDPSKNRRAFERELAKHTRSKWPHSGETHGLNLIQIGVDRSLTKIYLTSAELEPMLEQLEARGKMENCEIFIEQELDRLKLQKGMLSVFAGLLDRNKKAKD